MIDRRVIGGMSVEIRGLSRRRRRRNVKVKFGAL